MSLKTIGSMGNVPSSFWGVGGIMMVLVYQDFNESGIDFQMKPPALFLTRLISIQSMMREGNINQQVIHDLTIGFSRS